MEITLQSIRKADATDQEWPTVDEGDGIGNDFCLHTMVGLYGFIHDERRLYLTAARLSSGLKYVSGWVAARMFLM